jgi:hypothetical protein
MTSWWWKPPIWWEPPINQPKYEENPAPKPNSVTLFADDDLIARAEKLVYLMGIRGSTGDHVLTIYKALKLYAALDKQEMENETTPSQEIDTPNAGPRTLG